MDDRTPPFAPAHMPRYTARHTPPSHSEARTRMTRIKVAHPIVDIDGDELTRIIGA